MIRDVK